VSKSIIQSCWRSWRFWLIAAIAAGLVWRLTDYFLRFPIWDDEASLGLNIVHRSYLGLIQPLTYGQVCPIGFLWISKLLIQCFGTDVWVLRFIPLIAGIAAVLLAWPVFKSLAGRRVGLLATALVACSLATNRFGTDFKPYSLDLLAALCVVGLTLRTIARPNDRRPMMALALLTPVAVAMSYPSVFVLGAALMALLPVVWGSKDRITRLTYLLWAGVTALSFATAYFGVIRGQMHHTHTFMQEFWHNAFPPHGPAILLWLVDAHISNMMSYPFGGSKGIALLIAPLVLLGLVRLWHKRRWSELILLAGPFVLTFLAAFLHKYPYGADARVEQHLVPSIALLASLGAVTACAVILRKSRNVVLWRSSGNLAVAVMISFALIMTAKDICYPWRTPAPLLVQKFIARIFAHPKSNSQIVILNKHPWRYNVLLSWQLATVRHPFFIAPDVAQFKSSGDQNIWLVHFHFRHAAPLSSQVLRQFQRHMQNGRIATNITRRLHEPFSGQQPVYMQAIHIVARK
jgi:4-amino-4-deoxy-L-arabinose transferase-like glycosyltransferase